ncbi:hypothetical protein [Promicromonospora sukumoe]
MADGTQDQVSDQQSETDELDQPEAAPPAESVPGSEDSAPLDAPAGDVTARRSDTGRVARIVAALRTAHAEQAARSAETATPDAGSSGSMSFDVTPAASTDDADTAVPEPLTPRRETSGVRPAAPAKPTLRWNPGVRYRASQLANQQAAAAAYAPVPTPPVPAQQVPGPQAGMPPVPMPPVPLPPVPLPPVPAPPAGAPQPLAGRLFRGPARRTAVFEREIWYPAARSSRVPSDVGEALVAAVERYRKGSISTSGLVRAIGSAHAA